MGRSFHVLSVVLVLGSLSWAANATRALNDYPVVDSFGEDWIKQFGYESRTFRFLLAQKSTQYWPKKANLATLAAKRADFQAQMQSVLASYLDILPVRIRFVSDQQPDRSSLQCPAPPALDVRSYIDVKIEYPSKSPFVEYPKDITASSAWLLGADGDTTFMARWGIGLTFCDPLDPDYAFTNPFPGDGYTKEPLCNRAVEIFAPPPPQPQVTYALTLEVPYDSIVTGARRRSLLDISIDPVDLFKANFENGVTSMLLAHYNALGRNPGAIRVTVVSLEKSETGKMVVHFEIDIENEDLAADVLVYIKDCEANNIGGLLPASFLTEYKVSVLPRCPPVDGFFANLRGYNHLNDTIRTDVNVTLDMLAADCISDPACAGFDGMGNIKSSVVNVTQDANSTMCLYERNITYTPCAPIPGFDATRGFMLATDAPLEYGTNSSMSLDSIAALCASDYYCSAFVATSNASSSMYNFSAAKNSSAIRAYNNNTCLYIWNNMLNTTCPDVPGYIKYAGTIDGGIVGTKEDSVGTQAMGSACTLFGTVYKECTAFDNQGNLYGPSATQYPGTYPNGSTPYAIGDDDTCYYVQACPQVTGATVYNGTLSQPYTTVIYTDTQDIENQCAANATCTGFDSFGGLYDSTNITTPHAWLNGTMYNIGDGGECFFTLP